MSTLIDITGQTFGTLTVIERAGSYAAAKGTHATWTVQCECGATKEVRGNFLRKGQTTTCGNRKAHPNLAQGKSEHYNVIHKTVAALYGPATDYRCIDCPQDATDWSHVHGEDPRDPDSYMPRCRTCHIKYDAPKKTSALV